MRVTFYVLVASAMMCPEIGFAACNTTVNPGEDVSAAAATGSEGPHIKGNYFENNEQVLTAFDRIANATVEDNVFVSGTSSAEPNI